MKHPIVLVMTYAVFAAAAQAQQPASSASPPPLWNCYLEVKNVSDVSKIQRNWESSWGSFDRDKFHRLALNVRVGTVGRGSGPVTVSFFWIGRKLIDHSLIVYGQESKNVAVPPAYFTEFLVVAPELQNNETNYAALGERYVSGARHDGWIVSVAASGRELASAASSELLRRLFANTTEFAKLQNASQDAQTGEVAP